MTDGVLLCRQLAWISYGLTLSAISKIDGRWGGSCWRAKAGLSGEAYPNPNIKPFIELKCECE